MPKPKPKTKDLSEIRIFVSPKTHETMTERAAFVGASIAPYVAKIVERAAASRPIDDAEWREAASTK